MLETEILGYLWCLKQRSLDTICGRSMIGKGKVHMMKVNNESVGAFCPLGLYYWCYCSNINNMMRGMTHSNSEQVV